MRCEAIKVSQSLFFDHNNHRINETETRDLSSWLLFIQAFKVDWNSYWCDNYTSLSILLSSLMPKLEFNKWLWIVRKICFSYASLAYENTFQLRRAWEHPFVEQMMILGYYIGNARIWSGCTFSWPYILMMTEQVFCDVMQLLAKRMNAKISRASKETFLI